MVKQRSGLVLLCLALAALFLLLQAPPARAQEWGEEEPYSLQEEYRVELNELGEGHITDTIEYDPQWFEENVDIFEENPNLLSRRYRSDTNTGETENFDVEIDRRKSAIVVSFDTPGLAYNLSDGWNLFGFGDYQLVEESDDRVVLEAYWTLNGEFTLFETMSLEETVVIELPEGAVDVHFDESTGAVKYDLPYREKAAGNALGRNKGLFVPLFAVLAGLSLVLLLFAITRKPTAGVAEGYPPAIPTPQVPAGTTGPGPAAPAPPPVAPAVPPPAPSREEAVSPLEPGIPAGETSRFCRKCGHPRGSANERFCRKCGAPLG